MHSSRSPRVRPRIFIAPHRRRTKLDQIFHLEETRVVGLDWVVRYHNRALQLARQSGQAPARSTVTVCEWEDGRLAITYRGQPIRWTEGRTARPLPTLTPRPVPLPVPCGAVIRTKPAATHPWRQGYENLRKTATLWQAIKSEFEGDISHELRVGTFLTSFDTRRCKS